MTRKLFAVLFFSILLWMPFFNKPVLSQIIFSGDFDLKVSTMNLRRTAINDSLEHRLYGINATAELDFAYVRKRFSAMFSLNSLFTLGTTLFSTQPQPLGKLGIYQAWVNYYFSKQFALQAGRIEIAYDDEMFFEARDWSGLSTGHNAVIAHFLKPDTSSMADIGIAANRFNGAPKIFWTDQEINNYRYMSYLYMHRRFLDDNLNLTFMNIFNADDNGWDRNLLYGRNTMGGSAWLTAGDWNFNLTGYYQFGHVNDGRRLSSWYYAGYVAWQPLDWLVIMPAYEHLSGDNLSDSAEWMHTVHGFGMLYGNMTRTFGNSGIFNYAYRRNLHPGLNNLYFKADFEILDNLILEASYHWFSLPYPYIRRFNPDSLRIEIVRVDKSLMHQAEFELTYSPLPNLDLTFDFILMIPGAAMVNYNGWKFKPGAPVTGAYIEVEWIPVFIPRKKKHILQFP